MNNQEMWKIAQCLVFVSTTVSVAASVAFALPGGCNELATSLQNEMKVPLTAIADKRIRRCVKRQTVNSLNMPLYIATAFYDKSLDERARAFDKIKAYSCESENTCKKLFALIDTHLKATILTKTVDSRDLFAQLDSFRDQLHYQLNSD